MLLVLQYSTYEMGKTEILTQQSLNFLSLTGKGVSRNSAWFRHFQALLTKLPVFNYTYRTAELQQFCTWQSRFQRWLTTSSQKCIFWYRRKSSVQHAFSGEKVRLSGLVEWLLTCGSNLQAVDLRMAAVIHGLRIDQSNQYLIKIMRGSFVRMQSLLDYFLYLPRLTYACAHLCK